MIEANNVIPQVSRVIRGSVIQVVHVGNLGLSWELEKSFELACLSMMSKINISSN